MRALVPRVWMAGVLITGSLAVAPPALAECAPTILPSFTVGVGGQPVTTTPLIGAGLCGNPTVGAPEPRVETYGPIDFGLFLDFPPGGSTEKLSVGVRVGSEYREVVVPVQPPGGGEVCVLFYGQTFDNPGGCLFYIER